MTGALAIPDATALDQAADPAQYVELACQRAKEWLAIAIEHGEIEQIVELKSQAEAIRIYTQQKQLGKDAELSAAEIVRRAERGIGVAIRRGQEEGSVQSPGNNLSETISPRSAFSCTRERQETYAITDGVSDDTFEEIIEEAKQEGNLSRANVVRKAARKRIVDAPDVGAKRLPAEQRAEQIRSLTAQGNTPRQIARTLGIGEEQIRSLASAHGITLISLGKTRHIDSNRVVGETVAALDGLAMGVGLIEVDDLDPQRVEEWATSLSNSLRPLNRLAKQLKEMTRD